MNSKEIIKKWYGKIGFAPKYDEEFYNALENYEIDENVTLEDYNLKEEDGKKNFLYFLYFCEETQRKYNELGIGEDILMDTLLDMTRWLDTWSDLKGGLYLGELEWLSHHLGAKLFKLGRLQFCFADHYEFKERGIKKGDTVIDTHIPAEGPLDIEECKKSFEFAKEFFGKFYPDYKWEVFTCHSWLLGEDLKEILNENSNIIKFQNMFTIDEQFESDAVLAYTFRWKIKRDELDEVEAKSSFAKKVKELALNGNVFHGGSGYINK